MCFWILRTSGIPIARSTVQEISHEQLVKTELRKSDEAITIKHWPTGTLEFDLDDGAENTPETPTFEPWEPESTMPDADE